MGRCLDTTWPHTAKDHGGKLNKLQMRDRFTLLLKPLITKPLVLQLLSVRTIKHQVPGVRIFIITVVTVMIIGSYNVKTVKLLPLSLVKKFDDEFDFSLMMGR
jgi:hypothetical protein